MSHPARASRLDGSTDRVRSRHSPWRAAWLVAVAGVALTHGGCAPKVVQSVPESVPDAPTGAGRVLFPLTMRAGERCLVDRTGAPFLLQGDSAWTLLVQLRRGDVDRYLADRRSRGFNTLLVMLLDHAFAVNAPRNAYGEAPFIDAGVFARPNEKYFAHVDWVLRRAAEEGFLVLLAPSYLGYRGGGQGWYEEMRDVGNGQLRAFGRYLGMRYQKLPNIIWLNGGDFTPNDRSPVLAIVDGLRDTDPGALHSFHAKRGISARAYLGDDAEWLSLNTIYTDKDGVVDAALSEYRASWRPFVLVEATYEGEGASAAVARSQAYQAMLSGACGQIMGNRPVWRFDPNWPAALDSPAARSMTRLRVLLEKWQWSQLRPAPNEFVIDGAGSGSRRIAAAMSGDGRRAVIYVPDDREIVLDTSFLPRPVVTGSWINPASADPSSQEAQPIRTSRRTPFHTPATHSDGFGDWVLVLEATPDGPGAVAHSARVPR